LAATLSQSYRVLVLERGGVPYGNPNLMNQERFLATLTEVDTFDSHAQAKDGVPNARGHILGGNSSINAGFYGGADQQFYQKSGVNWDLRVVNEPYEWVEKAVVFRPELRNWQSLVRADVPFLGSRAPSDPFRRAESKYSVEQVGVTVEFYGGELNGVSYSDPATVKKDAIRAQLGDICELDRATLKSDGVFRSSLRGWFTFGHTSFAFLIRTHLAWCYNLVQRCFCW